MNVYLQIAQLPTTYNDVEHGKTHESLLRAFNILGKVKSLLADGTPPHVVLELIELMETRGVSVEEVVLRRDDSGR